MAQPRHLGRAFMMLNGQEKEEIQRMREGLDQYIVNEIPFKFRPNTKSGYNSAYRRWLEFCWQCGYLWHQWNKKSIEHFIAWRRVVGSVYTGEPCMGSTIRANLSGIRAALIVRGAEDLVAMGKYTTPRAKMLLDAIISHDESKRKYPLDEEKLERMMAILNPKDHNARVLRFYLAISHNTMRRSEEVLCKETEGMKAMALVWQNGTMWPRLTAPYDRTVSYCFTRSKTNKNGRIQTALMWCRCPSVCAICTLRELYFGSPWKMKADSEILTFDNGNVMTYGMALKYVQGLAAKIGEDPKKYGTHSMRSGGLKDAKKRGYSDDLINGQAGWAGNRSRDAYEKAIAADIDRMKLNELKKKKH